MPKRAAQGSSLFDDSPDPPTKRARAGQHHADQNDSPTATVTSSLPMNQWRVVLTGIFDRKPTLEASLKAKGVKVTQAISGKTTHLVLGRTGRNDYGRLTGVGSSKYSTAVSKGIPIVTVAELLRLLRGTGDNRTSAHTNAGDTVTLPQQIIPKKPSKRASAVSKVVFVMNASNEPKLSLPKIKKELADHFDMSFEDHRTRNSLKKALKTCVDDGRLRKVGASYESPTNDDDDDADNDGFDYDVAYFERENKIEQLCPVRGRWRGLFEVKRKVSNTARAICGGCDGRIRKGEVQVTVSDDSLFRMLVFPGDAHEGVTRGYVECSYPGFDVVGRKRFNIHEECKGEATRLRKAVFDRDWQQIRQHVIQDRL